MAREKDTGTLFSSFFRISMKLLEQIGSTRAPNVALYACAFQNALCGHITPLHLSDTKCSEVMQILDFVAPVQQR